MSKTVQRAGLFKTQSQSRDSKADATTRAAREIDAREKALVDAKTARLKALRLAKEAADAAAAAEAPPAPKAAKKAKAAR